RAATDLLSSESVRTYLKLARSMPESENLEASCRILRETLKVTGALEFQSGHARQCYHDLNFFSEATGWIQSTAAAFAKFVNRHPLSRWDGSELDSLLA